MIFEGFEISSKLDDVCVNNVLAVDMVICEKIDDCISCVVDDVVPDDVNDAEQLTAGNDELW